MARKTAYKPQRKDWTEMESFELADGGTVTKWLNIITSEEATLREGVHPMDNPNAIGLPAPMQSAPVPMVSNDVDDDTIDDVENDERDAVDSVMRMLRGGTFAAGRADVKLYRKRSDGGLEYCSKYTPEEFLEGGHDLIRESWGPGRYQVILYATNEAGKNYARRAMNEVNIAQPPINAGKPATESDRVLSLLERMDSRIAQLETNKPDPTAQMMQTLALMKAMREAMGINNAPAPAPAAVDPMQSIKSTLELIEMLKDQANPKPEPDDPFSVIAPKAIDLLSSVMKQNQQPEMLPQIQHAPLAMAQPIAQPITQPEMQPQESEEQMQIKLAAFWLKSQATANADPSDTAETAWQFVPDEVVAVLRTDQWLQFLTQVDPALGAHAVWLSSVRDALLKIADEESAEESAPENVTSIEAAKPRSAG